MKAFQDNRPYIANEFEEAVFDPATGLDVAALRCRLLEFRKEEDSVPFQLLYAKAYAWLLDHVQLQLNPHTPFAVKLNVGIDYSAFAGPSIFQKTVAAARGADLREKYLPEENKQYKAFASVGLEWMWVDFCHTVPNWPYLLEQGFAGILENARQARQKQEDHETGRILFLDSVILCFEAILRLLDRIYTYSLQFDMPEFSACIKALATRPPESLYEVMQFSVLYLYFEELGQERGRTLGPIDSMYAPYFEKDLQKGMSEAELRELFRYYFMHFTASKRYAEQPFTMCGSDREGRDLTNPLSHLILDVYDELNIYDPKIQIRCHKTLDPRILEKAARMIRSGNNSLCLVNDEAVYRGYERLGIPRKDAQNYVLLGCYEPIIMGMEEGEISALRFNLVKCIEFALNGGRDMLTGNRVSLPSKTDIGSFSEFFDIFLQHLDYGTDFALDIIQKQGLYSTRINSAPIYSAGFPECLQQGKDVHEYPLKYNNLSLKHHGLATAVDSLVAVKKYVYDQKLLTLEQLRQALLQDWKGFETLQHTILQDKEKYGNNLPVPDALMQAITDHLVQRYCGRKLARGGRLRLGLDSVYHCIAHGEKTAATPDGRNARKPISKNLCAVDGMDRGGITAYMQSVLKIDTAGFVDGVPLDFILHPSAVEGEKGLQAFVALLRIFFENGGFAIQGNVVNRQTLLDAQVHPEKYTTLQVRVCGWNEYFVKLSKVKQDLFIKQCEVVSP